MTLRDNHNRVANYLRLAVTDRCNLRCRYCMPAEGIDFAKRTDILSYEEILRLVRIFSDLGVNKIRLTGGEPFVRKDMYLLLKEMSAIIPDIYITTNATLLKEHIPQLKEIGVKGMNISIDSLNRDRFFMITRRDSFDLVMSNILASIDSGILTKLNVVTMKGVNDMEILDFVEFGIKHNVEVRFIEAMPFNEDDGNKSVFISSRDIENIIQKRYASLEKISSEKGTSSDVYLINEKYRIGIIPAYTRSLCGFCNRIRLTPKGEFLTCLYAQKGLNLLHAMRSEKLTDQELKTLIKNSVAMKSKSGFEEEMRRNEDVFQSMTTIGG